MSVDKSLKLQSALMRQRSVLTRVERLAELGEKGKWDEEQSVFGLPKVRVRKAKRKTKAKAETPEAAAAPGAAPEAPAETDAAKK